MYGIGNQRINKHPELYMFYTMHVYKLIRTNQQLCTKFTKLYLH
jgi:hypothetical protein